MLNEEVKVLRQILSNLNVIGLLLLAILIAVILTGCGPAPEEAPPPPRVGEPCDLDAARYACDAERLRVLRCNLAGAVDARTEWESLRDCASMGRGYACEEGDAGVPACVR